MTREEFKARWEKDELGGGLTYDDVAKCAVEWGVCGSPRTKPLNYVLNLVLKEADISQKDEGEYEYD